MKNHQNNNKAKENKMILARAYVHDQPEGSSVYTPENGLKAGTIYPDLDQPYQYRYGK